MANFRLGLHDFIWRGWWMTECVPSAVNYTIGVSLFLNSPLFHWYHNNCICGPCMLSLNAVNLKIKARWGRRRGRRKMTRWWWQWGWELGNLQQLMVVVGFLGYLAVFWRPNLWVNNLDVWYPIFTKVGRCVGQRHRKLCCDSGVSKYLGGAFLGEVFVTI